MTVIELLDGYTCPTLAAGGFRTHPWKTPIMVLYKTKGFRSDSGPLVKCTSLSNTKQRVNKITHVSIVVEDT